MAQPLTVDNEKQALERYYGGRQIESPTGGFLMLLGVRPSEGGGAMAIFECSASSLRYRVDIPKATRTERKKVKDALDAGEDPHCPRHGSGHRLVRAGKELACPACGISYAKI